MTRTSPRRARQRCPPAGTPAAEVSDENVVRRRFFHLSLGVPAVYSQGGAPSGSGSDMADAQVICPRATAPAAEHRTDRELMDRFLRLSDQAAFAALVQRHGPMVLGLCRRVLDNEQDAEDAFQATFLILVRRAASIQNPDLLGSWLYGVAYRTARKARTQLARRRQQERQAGSVTAALEPSAGQGWRELRSALDDELNRLPEKYRLPLVLCYLEGLTNEE